MPLRFAGSNEFEGKIKEIGGTRFSDEDPLRVHIPGVDEKQSGVLNRIINNNYREDPQSYWNRGGANIDSITDTSDPEDYRTSTEGLKVEDVKGLPEDVSKQLIGKYGSSDNFALPGAQNIRRFKAG